MLDLAAANATALKYGTWGKDVVFEFQSLTLRNFSIVTQQLRDILADVDVLIEETRFINPGEAPGRRGGGERARQEEREWRGALLRYPMHPWCAHRLAPAVIRNVDLKLSDVVSLYGFNSTDVRTLKFFRCALIQGSPCVLPATHAIA